MGGCDAEYGERGVGFFAKMESAQIVRLAKPGGGAKGGRRPQRPLRIASIAIAIFRTAVSISDSVKPANPRSSPF